MAFGNPYGEHWHPDLVCSIVEKLNQIGIEKVSLSDTIGVSCSENISPLFKLAIKDCTVTLEYLAIVLTKHSDVVFSFNNLFCVILFKIFIAKKRSNNSFSFKVKFRKADIFLKLSLKLSFACK